MGLLQSGGFDWLHLASHGRFSGAEPDRRSALLLDGRQFLTPQDLIGARVEEGLKDHPAFFFNACDSGRIGWGLSGLAGWADRLISSGASLFLGPLWKVEDDAAARFALNFYRHLVAGEATAAEALYQARSEARRDGGATWLAYSLYAHPNARVRLHAALPPEASEPGPTATPGSESDPV
jgi:CHAT domain-containing protein